MIGITSFYFLCFYGAVLFLYYTMPKKFQWHILLGASIAYYLLAGNGWLLLYPVATAVVCYLGGHMISVTEHSGKKKAALFFSLLGTVGILFVLKYVNFGIYTYNGIASLVQGKQADILQFLLPLGISFYTLSLLGYVVDLYYGIGKVSRNFFQFLLYGIFFPLTISGPILRYSQTIDELCKPHSFQYGQVTKGMQRMVWGFFKKLVIAERAAMIVNTVYNDYTAYRGSYFWIASVCFVIQLYTDFSGCMDIVLGLAQTFDIRLPENFQTPFFSKSIGEYWRRWHMTLGHFMKEYVFYPLLKSGLFVRLGQYLRGRLGKKRGKQITTFCAMFLLWFTVGIWHGGEWKYVLSSGLFHWFYIVLGEVVGPVFAGWMQKRGWNPRHGILEGLRILRTFGLVTLADVFFRAESVGVGIQIWKSMFTVWNPMVLFSGTLFTMGLDWVEFIILIVSLLILLMVSVWQEKKGNVREQIAAWKLPIRWAIWYGLLFYTILLGYYGPGYSAAEFIYQGF